MFKRVMLLCVVMFLAFAPLALAQGGYEPPKSIELPGFLETIISFFSSKWVFPFAFSGIVAFLVQLLRSGVALFGGKLGEKGIYVAGLLISLLTTVSTAGADGSIAGDEWWMVFSVFISLIGAVLGFKVTFSTAAKARIKNAK